MEFSHFICDKWVNEVKQQNFFYEKCIQSTFWLRNLDFGSFKMEMKWIQQHVDKENQF